MSAATDGWLGLGRVMGASPGGPARAKVDPDVLESFFRHAGDGVLVINRQRRIVLINPAASQITGWQARDLTSINCSVFNCRDERGKRTCEESCLAQRCVETGQQIGPLYLRLSRAGGGYAAVEATYLPSRPGAGTCMLLVKDVTVLEGLDAEVRRLNGAVAERNIVLRGFAEQMSTAWRTAIVDLRGAAETLRGRYARELGEAGLRLADRIVQATQQLEQTFAQLRSQIQVAPPERPAPPKAP
jgi:PAS domain S-box-containing protein